MPGEPVYSKQRAPEVTSSDSKGGDRSLECHVGAKIPDFRGYDSRRARSYMRDACLVSCAGDDSA
jgi:hypothetical protein